MKIFCILEQGKLLNDLLTIKKKKLFTTDFSDFYRLNWYTEADSNASIIKKGITWSEGRSFLYEKVPKNYKYYIFIDDDIDFKISKDNLNIDIATKIKELLEEYQPISATFFDSNRWKKNDKSFPKSISKETYLSRKIFPIAFFDPQVFILSQSFADVIFPIIYHGGSSTLRYANWACHNLFPLKQMCFSEIEVENTREDLRFSQSKKKYTSPTQIRWLFNKDMKDKLLIMPVHQSSKGAVEMRERNLVIFDEKVNTSSINFSLKDLATIYNINNYDFVNRKSVIDNEYRERTNYNNKIFLRYMKLDNLAQKMGIKFLSKYILSI